MKTIETYCTKGKVAEKISKEELIPPKQLIKLLSHVNLVTPIAHVEVDDSKRITYLMPALLELTSLDELTSPPSPDANNPEPLYITFNAGYAPLGTFCGLITRLISLGPNGIFGLNWELVEDGIKRNCVSFLIAKSNKVTLISSETCFEIRLTRSQSLMSLHDLCSHVLTVILYVMKSLYKNLVPRVAFQCSCPYYIESGRSDNHLCVLTEEPQVLFLCQSRPVNLKIYQQVWLGKVSVHYSFAPHVKSHVIMYCVNHIFSAVC